MGAVEAKLFAREGAKVVIGDVLEDEGKQTEAEINEAGGQCLFAMLDVTSEENWNQTVAATVARFGKVDILVNNAGIFTLGNVEDTTVEMWDRVMAINGKGVFLGTKAVIPEMRKVGGGSIINLSSVAGLIGSARAAAYGATKGAVRIFTKSTAVQYAKEGIRANSVHPGIIDTPMTVPTILVDDASREAQMERTPLGRLGQSEDVANGVLFLASDESSFMTGSELVIDGGLTAQ
jgi:NAD(P)-dependent dehydrogenase (short-subunit alcohol dehydrogenase family)